MLIISINSVLYDTSQIRNKRFAALVQTIILIFRTEITDNYLFSVDGDTKSGAGIGPARLSQASRVVYKKCRR